MIRGKYRDCAVGGLKLRLVSVRLDLVELQMQAIDQESQIGRVGRGEGLVKPLKVHWKRRRIPPGATALSVSTDALVFNEAERGPTDTRFAVHFEALDRLDDEEKATILDLIESFLLRQEARRLARTS